MSLPHEKRKSLLYTLDFLLALRSAKDTPRVPLEIRDRARHCLRHFPGRYEIEQFKMLEERHSIKDSHP